MIPVTVPTPTPPVVACVICNQTMRADWQPALVSWRTGDYLLTCETPVCPMHDQTLCMSHYPPDLTLYLDPFPRYVEYEAEHLEIVDIEALAAQSKAEIDAFVHWLLGQYGILESWHAAECVECEAAS